jgi:beta-galactosidase GanA
VKYLSTVGTLLAALAVGQASAGELPHLVKNGQATQLIVNGAPYIGLGGELHNSSASSPAYMAPIWDRLAANHVGTVIGVASWELVEPAEGTYDFTAVDDQIRQAKARRLRLVLIWFGAYKNAESTYAPTWVRHDMVRFPRAQRDPAGDAKDPQGGLRAPVLSVFGEPLVRADAKAFAALMRHIRKVDAGQTVIMVQVENEVGLLGYSRDRAPLAEAAWGRPVPSDLIAYLRTNRGKLRPQMSETWGRQGFRESGTWAEVFGTDTSADEIFMAWNFGQYVDRVAKAGAAEYPLPMYTNAWLGPQASGDKPGVYPSGGPVARMMDVWKAAAPSLALLAPDIYVDDFEGTLADFRRPDNPIFVPEARFDAANLFVALGQYDAIGFSPFGIEDGADNHEVFQAYRLLGEMTGIIADAQRDGRIRGFKMRGATHQETFGDYSLTFSPQGGTLDAFGPGTGKAAEPKATIYGLVIQQARDEFLIIGRGFWVNFAAKGSTVEIHSAQEGVFAKSRWIAGRTMNGDERWGLFPNDGLRIIRVKLLRR